jgi:nitrogen fixation protein FixH
MKINWGTGLVIGMALFISFILVMVFKMTTNENFSHDLVTEAYYKKELAYQDEIDAEENLNDFSEKIAGIKVEKGWQLTFPSEIDPSMVEGTVFLYRPSNKQLDFEIPIEMSGTNLLIPDKSLLDGRWNITMAWKYKNENYLYKASIRY